jgi:hypothetical protein
MGGRGVRLDGVVGLEAAWPAAAESIRRIHLLTVRGTGSGIGVAVCRGLCLTCRFLRELCRSEIVGGLHSVGPGSLPSGGIVCHLVGRHLLLLCRCLILRRRSWEGTGCCLGSMGIVREDRRRRLGSRVRWGRRRSGVWLGWREMMGMLVRMGIPIFHTGSVQTSRFHRRRLATWLPSPHSCQVEMVRVRLFSECWPYPRGRIKAFGSVSPCFCVLHTMSRI